MITQAAIFQNGKIYTGKRHCFIIQEMVEKYGLPKPIKGMQGFVDQDGKFYSRQGAALEAQACGQIKEIPGRVFLSEDLW